MACYAHDVTFKPRYRPSGGFSEGMIFYSAKHMLNVFKAKVSVLATDFAIRCSSHYPVGVSELIIYQEMQRFSSDNDEEDAG